MEDEIEIRIPSELYDEICIVCDDPDDFCVRAVKRFMDVFLVD